MTEPQSGRANDLILNKCPSLFGKGPYPCVGIEMQSKL